MEDKTDYIQDTNYAPEDQDHFNQIGLSINKKKQIIQEIDNCFIKELDFDIDQSKSLSDFHQLVAEVVKTHSSENGLHTEIKKKKLQDDIKNKNMEENKTNTEDFEVEIMRRLEEKKAKESRMIKPRETEMKISREIRTKQTENAIIKKSKKSLLNKNELFKKARKLELTEINEDKNNKQIVIEVQKETKVLGTNEIAKLKKPKKANTKEVQEIIRRKYENIKDKKLRSNNDIEMEKTNGEMIRQDYKAKLIVIDKRIKFKKIEHVTKKEMKEEVSETKKTEFVNFIDTGDKNAKLSKNEAKLQKDGLFTSEEKSKISKISEQSTVDTGRINAQETTKEFQSKFNELQEDKQEKMAQNNVNQNKNVQIVARSIKLKESNLISQQNKSQVLENENKSNSAKQLKASVALSGVNNVPVSKEKDEPFINNISLKQPETKT